MSNMLQVVFLGLLAVYSAQGWLFSDGEKKVCFVSPVQTCSAETEFLLFTQQNKHVPQNLTSDETHTQEQRIRESNFKGYRDTKFIIHGYTDQGDEGWAIRMAKKIIHYYDVNVICVNWQKSADNLFYGQAASNTRAVGETIASLIKDLVLLTGAEYTSFHLIGHSLGSHVSGFAGAKLGGKIGRITALDPAGPCFRFSKPEKRLSDDDAIFVDAIHTDGDPTVKAGFMKSLTCNHLRVLDMFEESINPDHKFTSCPCEKQADFKKCKDCAEAKRGRMGYNATTKERGVYTLITKDGPSYSLD